MLEDNLIIITNSKYEKKLINDNKLKYNIKIYSKQEFMDNYYFKYRNDILVHLFKKYNLIPEIGAIVLKNLYNINNVEYSTDKLNNLKNLKNELISDGYIIVNNNFKKFIENKKILVYNTTFLGFDNYFEDYTDAEKIKIYEYQTIEEEVLNVASKIEDLINNGVNINNIKINKLDSSYDGIINRIFSFYNIPFVQSSNNKLFYLDDIKKFLKTVDYNESIINLNEFIANLNMNHEIEAKLVNILNKYSNYKTLEEIKEILIYELKNTTVEIQKYTDTVQEINYKTYSVNDEDHIFMMGFNQDIIPVIHKDDLYLNDIELKEINEETSFERNKNEEYELKKFMNITKNLYISYKLESPTQEFGYSNFLTELSNIESCNNKYDYRNEFANKLMLAELLDNYILYNDKPSNLIDLYSNYQNLDYSTYDNNYETINYETIKKQLKNKINLSYTNLTNFYKCQFKFLLDNIYKIGTFRETTSQIIGLLFHKFLEVVYKDNREDYDEVITEVLNDFYKEGMTKKEEFYSTKYRKAMLNLIEIIKNNEEKSQFESTHFEQFFSIEKENDLEIKIVGYVDKILTFKSEDSTYVIVIDYKTGGFNNDLDKVVYGLDMQLLVYLYLIKHTKVIENPKYAGMYFQQIMDEVQSKDPKKTYEEQTIENRKLMGYTLSNQNILSKIDKDFDTDSFIKGIKLKKDGEFMSYSKVLDKDTIDSLIDTVGDNIDNAIEKITDSSFEINPKKIKNKNISCEYCEYKDICYMNNDNIVVYGGECDDSEQED